MYLILDTQFRLYRAGTQWYFGRPASSTVLCYLAVRRAARGPGSACGTPAVIQQPADMHAMPHFAVVLLLLAAAPLALADSCDPPCSSTQTCQQVFNSAAYECTEDTSDASSACDPACAAAEVCKQVFNSDAYECVAADTGAVTAPAPAAYQTNATGTASPVSATDSPAAASSSGGGSGLSGGVCCCAKAALGATRQVLMLL